MNEWMNEGDFLAVRWPRRGRQRRRHEEDVKRRMNGGDMVWNGMVWLKRRVDKKLCVFTILIHNYTVN